MRNVRFRLLLVVATGSILAMACSAEKVPVTPEARADISEPKDIANCGFPIGTASPQSCQDAAKSLSDCDWSECLQDQYICVASKWLDYAHSFQNPPAFGYRKMALATAQEQIEYALNGETTYGIIPQLKGVSTSFYQNCTAVTNEQSGPNAQRIARYYAKLSHLTAMLTEVVQELIEMDLAEADQALGLYGDYAGAREKEWHGFKNSAGAYIETWDPEPDPNDPSTRTDTLRANGSRNVALARLVGVSQSVAKRWVEWHSPGCYWYPPGCGDVVDQTPACVWVCPGGMPTEGTSYVPTGLSLANPCTIDPTQLPIKNALTLRRRFDFGPPKWQDPPPADPAETERQAFLEVVNAVLADENPDGGVPYGDGGVAKVFDDYGTTPEAFYASGVYLDQEATVMYRDAPPTTLKGTARPSIRGTPVSFGLVQQQRVRTRGQVEGYLSAGAGLRHELRQLRTEISSLAPTEGSQEYQLLDATRREINSQIGENEILWLSYVGDSPLASVLWECPSEGRGNPNVRQLIVVAPGFTQDYQILSTKVVYGLKNLACTLTGTYQGVACDPKAEPGDHSPFGLFLWQILGGTVQAYVGCHDLTSTDAEYRQRIDSPFVVHYDPTTKKWRVLDAADLGAVTDGTRRLAANNPIGGLLDELALRITERSPNNCGEAKYTSIGLERNLVPPLENELTDTGKPYEDSFAYYLTLADQAATDAYQQAEQARRTELQMGTAARKLSQDLKDLAADAQDQVQQVCGTGVTVDPASKEPACQAARVPLAFGDLNLPGVPKLVQPAPKIACNGGETDWTIPQDVGADDFKTKMRNYIASAETCVLEGLNKVQLKLPPEFADGVFSVDERGRYGGEYLLSLLDLQRQLDTLARVVTGMVGGMQAYEQHIEEMAQNIDQRDDCSYQMTISLLRASGNLAMSSSNLFDDLFSFGGKNAGAALVYAADTMQAKLDEDHCEAGLSEAVAKFKGDAISFITNLRQQAQDLQAAFTEIAEIDAKLTNLEQKQTRTLAAARRHQTSAEFLSDDNNPLVRATFNRDADRATRAIRRSKVMSYIARRAIEFKLVTNLSKETGTDPYVESPRNWADSVFAATHAGDPSDDRMDTWNESTVGYVKKLRDYVTAYPFIYPFQDGDDWAVISLRDDYLRPAGDCRLDTSLAPGRNLLRWSEDCDHESAWSTGDHQSGMPDWKGTNNACLIARQQEAQGTTESGSIDVSAAAGEWVTFSVWVKAGDPSPVDVDVTIRPECLLGECSSGWGVSTKQAGSSWTRVSTSFRLPADVTRVSVEVGTWAHAFVGGAQLELGQTMTAYQPTADIAPVAVANPAECGAVRNSYGAITGATLLPAARSRQLREQFGVKCVADSVVSPANTDCSERGGIEYYQLPFSFSIADMEQGKIIKDFQIAVGNYNYRVVDLGLNFVGSNVKDCELDDANREACYANMFLPYSMSQDGHVQLRDHHQQILEFGMPTGQINSAKGIAAERYLTIPLSSTDQTAITPYLKKEFRGRPLEGSYILRVYSVPSLAWDNLEDIQLLIHYRYWTAFGA
jgi:hypothetical protein